MLINGVNCEVFAHIDSKKTSDTLKFNVARRNKIIIAYLFADGKEFPVANSGVIASCCMKSNIGTNTVACTIGESGEILIPVPNEVIVDNNNISCEINISGTDRDNVVFRYKSANFQIAVVD